MTMQVVAEGALAFVAGWMGCIAFGSWVLARRGFTPDDVAEALKRMGRR